jgi:hypothetical protein
MQINRCPKCGREPVVARIVNDRYVLLGYQVDCDDCCLHTGRYGTRDEAIAKWNELTKGENK